MTEGTTPSFFANPSFKYITGNGELTRIDGEIDANIVPPPYSEIIAEEVVPCICLLIDDALFFTASNSVEIQFD